MSFLVACVGWPVSEETLRARRRLSNTLAKTTPVQARSGSPGGPCPGDYNGRAALHLARLFIPRRNPHGASSLIRDVSGETYLRPKRKRVHVDTAHHIAMSHKGTSWIAAAPDAPLHFLFPAAFRTLARRAPLRASEAHDAGEFGFVGEVSEVLPVLPGS